MVETSFEKYLKTYTDFLGEVAKETLEKRPDETKMLFEFIDNWIDLFPTEDERFMQATNSLSGIILINSWKLTNWISYEILTGKYFEAIRNLRFIFEGCVFAVIIEDAIESEVYKKWEKLGNLWLKTEIFRLWEECKKSKVYRNRNIDHSLVRELVSDFVNKNMESSRKNDIPQYVEVYSKILANKKLYMSTNKMVNECKNFLKLDEIDVDSLQNLWHELSNYQHFSHKYLNAVSEDADFCFVEKFHPELFQSAVKFYFLTLDIFYAVLVWRLPQLWSRITEMCKWWSVNFNNKFSLTEKVLKNMQE